ncbi:MAG: lysylphosphatidylglycerol synthase transmembrane domain-containing protein, partial [Kineosporiaceae bacterium]
RGGLILVGALIVEYAVLPQLAGARSAIHLLSTVEPGYLGMGLALELASLASYSALTRSVLPSADRPPYLTLLRIDVTGLGLSHVLPGGGATTTALRYRLLTLAGASRGDVVTATAIQGAGMAVVLALVFITGLLWTLPAHPDNPYLLGTALVAIALLVTVTAAAALLIRRPEPTTRRILSLAAVVPHLPQQAVRQLSRTLVTRLTALTTDPRLTATTIGWASANWTFDAASLWVFLRAFGQAEGLEGLLLGYGLAGLLALLPLTPGGLGLVEGTLVAVLVAFGAPHAYALLGVTTWRLAEFWLPIPLSALAYLSLRAGPLRPHHLPGRPVIPRPDHPLARPEHLPEPEH